MMIIYLKVLFLYVFSIRRKLEKSFMSQKVYIITSDEVFYSIFHAFLSKELRSVQIVKMETMSEIHTLKGLADGLVMVDAAVDDVRAIELIRILRSGLDVLAPLWFFALITNPRYAQKAFELGISRIIYRPFDPELISQEAVKLVKNE